MYNNVFNPIATEGTNGVSKELIRSYYEDPINEWKASKLAIDKLIALALPCLANNLKLNGNYSLIGLKLAVSGLYSRD